MEDTIYRTPNFIDKRISPKKAVEILEQNDVQVSEEEAVVILDFLYVIAKTYNRNGEVRNGVIVKRKSN